MTKSNKFAHLRKQAEEALRQLDKLPQLSAEQAQNALHELRVHQIELETQNEDLRQAQQQLAESRDRYADLYDLAPVGYFTVSEEGLIREVNLTGVTLLGLERRYLIGRPLSRFVAKDDEDIFQLHRKQAFESETQQICEVRMIKKDGRPFYAQLESLVGPDADGRRQLRIIMTDVSQRKHVEAEREQLIVELQAALDKVKLLSGLVPICANCKKIRDSEDYWHDVAVYIRDHSEAEFSHGICPDCVKELYPEFYPEL